MALKTRFTKTLDIHNQLHEAIYLINVGHNLSEELAYAAFQQVLLMEPGKSYESGEKNIFMGVLLNGVMAKGPTVEEVTGFIRAAFSLDGYTPRSLSEIHMEGKNNKVIGLAGSGKKGIKTMNVSSCAGIVAASLGVYIAKPCSSSTSSVTGSAEFIELVGANTDLDSKIMTSVMKKTGLGFYKIENRIPNFNSHYGGLFYAPHVLSFGLAAMILPFRPSNMLYGLAHPNVELSIKVMQRFNYKNAMTVSTTDDGVHFLDEIGIFGTTSIIGIRDGVVGQLIHVQPSEILDLPRYGRGSIKPGSSVEQNIKLGVDVLAGKGEPAREDIVAVNAGTLLYLAEKAEGLEDGYYKAKREIKSGRPIDKLYEFIKATSGRTRSLSKYL
ncbi:hypothetical protein A3D00_01070 [Candidatus Woesebacteria bacterium RIFCSPHIGHO2_02_FULL_38_9]|uniref:Glycosyl transferase family 3 domain-containing protein n=1 Tax=Candidatus Woesebacteria bacterium RIFCSPHIGHO2_01_FULL_39_28 TaxID=1802496 RepID=A0A1F7YH34_9BACT|nr:MAG: hypothetical protein A2627_01325 [Candidatus Woesebacteria bacterium RIFCSPHIGHO2_01_FULL_39_28]OGM31714.1 MAG: hypothetical protein A3D00_01070 [Candidatus Woesebacteria bacterium RIFCSPHIGHO2_02_FULL_38_9]OGM57655.1 MAG: hypothetical protein A3A50_01445 [Candidatus Woesebacteria bacterium RIFCSPLOWO2_01_FULL_38_20]